MTPHQAYKKPAIWACFGVYIDSSQIAPDRTKQLLHIFGPQIIELITGKRKPFIVCSDPLSQSIGRGRTSRIKSLAACRK